MDPKVALLRGIRGRLDYDVVTLTNSNIECTGTVRFDWDEIRTDNPESVIVDPEGCVRRSSSIDKAHLIGLACHKIEGCELRISKAIFVKLWAAIVRPITVHQHRVRRRRAAFT